jgi:hypothetical protein
VSVDVRGRVFGGTEEQRNENLTGRASQRVTIAGKVQVTHHHAASSIDSFPNATIP